MAFFGRLIDKLVFTLGCILAMQLPAFIVQYRQRVGGHLDEARTLLSSYQQLANKNHAGDLNGLVEQYINSHNITIQETGRIIQSNLDRVELLKETMLGLSNQSLWQDLYFFLLNFDSAIVKGAIGAFYPTVPLQLDAWVLGLIGGVLASGLINIGYFGCARCAGYVFGFRRKHIVDNY